MVINVQFQLFSAESGRPLDYFMNNHEMELTDLSLLPNIGDHMHFVDKESGEKGLFKVNQNFLGTIMIRTNGDSI